MPVYKVIEGDAIVGIWKIKEVLSELESLIDLNTEDTASYNRLIGDRRKKEWLATRILIQSIVKDISVTVIYDKHGKPFLSNNKLISISHTNGFVAVIIASNKSVGIDIQVAKKNIEKGAYSFLSAKELDELKGEEGFHKAHLYWCAKEAFYKQVGDSSLNIYSHFFICPFQLKQKGILQGLLFNSTVKISLSYEIYDAFYLVWTV